ncbi:MAG: hypothetical protein QG597_2238 [Actinomycetota bacterium]|nr:hypothetical protein [Actinomycetota bacterium]
MPVSHESFFRVRRAETIAALAALAIARRSPPRPTTRILYPEPTHSRCVACHGDIAGTVGMRLFWFSEAECGIARRTV